MKEAIKKIIVPLDASEYGNAAIQKACEIAQVHGATLTGLTILDLPGITSNLSPGDVYIPVAIDETLRRFIESAEEHISSARRKFVETCEAAHVSHLDPSTEGVPSSLILDASKLHDLMVVGLRTFFDFATMAGEGSSIANLLNRTVIPILAVPKGGGNKEIKRALIAYDGSMNAARALRDFVAFAKPFSFEITLMTAEENGRQAEWLLQDAASYLRAHGLNHFELSHRSEKTIPDYIIDEYDLVAAGIHSKRFLIDRGVGGFTKKLIDRDDLLLFLSH